MTPLLEKPSRKFVGPAIIIIAALLANLLQMLWGNSCGHDFDFHLVSWLDCQNSWRHGVFYPHWAPSANFGAGEPRFVFYPPLTWMLGAALGLVLPWKAVPIAMTVLLLAATGLATRTLAREALDDGPATLAGCAAVFCGYTMFTTYERSAYGELAGGFWIPILLLLILRDRNHTTSVWRRAFDGSTVPLTLVLAGAWLSNAPLGVMASYLLAAVALVVSLQVRSWAPLLRATVACVLGLGLVAIYLVPAAIEQRWVEISQATEDPGEKIENSWLFARHANRALELHDVELLKVSGIATIMIAVTLIAVFVSWRRNTLTGHRAWWVSLALIPVAVLLLQFPLSLPVWNTLPKLRFLQFPWRWLVVLEAPMGIFFASAVWVTRLRLRVAVVAVCSVFFLGVGAFSSFVFFQFCDTEDSVRGTLEAYRSGKGFEGTDEYAPGGADNSLVATGLPDACFTSNPKIVLGSASEELTPAYVDGGTCETAYSRAGNLAETQPEQMHIAVTTPHAGYLVLKLRSYPAWQVKVNGSAAHSLPERDDGLMAVPVPQGPVNLTVDWTTTSDVILGRWLSLVAMVLVAGLSIVERKLATTANGPAKPRLS